MIRNLESVHDLISIGKENMIRFIDLGDQIYCDDESRSFAFFNTIYDQFVTFDNGEVYFDSWKEFEESYNSVLELQKDHKDVIPLERFKSLCPPWVFE